MSNYFDNMTLTELEAELREGVGRHLRWENDILEEYGDTATEEQKIEAAKKVLASRGRGVNGLGREHTRRKRLLAARSTETSD